jgi:hypothetical protein
VTDDLEFRRDKQVWGPFRAEIARRLNELRPERITMGETDWREPVYAWARNHMPDESHLVRHVAKREVDRQEREATKRGNDLIRDYGHGRMPLEWSLVGPYPVNVDKVRVRLDVATPDDIDAATVELLAKGRQTFEEVMLLVETLRYLAQRARSEGHATVAAIGDLPAREQESA